MQVEPQLSRNRCETDHLAFIKEYLLQVYLHVFSSSDKLSGSVFACFASLLTVSKPSVCYKHHHHHEHCQQARTVMVHHLTRSPVVDQICALASVMPCSQAIRLVIARYAMQPSSPTSYRSFSPLTNVPSNFRRCCAQKINGCAEVHF